MEEHNEVKNPEYYAWFEAQFGIRLWDVCRQMGFTLGNVLKYVFRAGRKIRPGQDMVDAKLEDLRKARAYLDLYIELLEESLPARDRIRNEDLRS